MQAKIKACSMLLGVLAVSFCNSLFAASGDTWSTRSVSLREVGFTLPLMLNNRIRERHLFLPIAQNANVQDVLLELDASYLRQFISTDGLTILINGVPTRSVSLGQGSNPSFLHMTSLDGTPVSLDAASELNTNIKLQIPLKNLDANTRFVDVGLSFNSKTDAEHCTEIEGRANELLISPDSFLRYRFNRANVKDVRSFLTTLPKQPRVVLPSSVTAVQYEAALRLVMGLAHQGMKAELVSFPSVGREMVVRELKVPTDLAKLDFFTGINAAISQRKNYLIANERDLAAWLALSLSAENKLADVVLDATALRAALLKSGAIWRNENILKALPSDAMKALVWAEQQPLVASNLNLVNWAKNQVLLIDAPQENPAALLTSSFWADIANSAELNVIQALPITTEGDSYRVMIARNLPVQYLKNSIHWDLPFAAKDLPNGAHPNALQINIISAHRQGDLSAVVSVYMNDFLLTAKNLRDDGEVTAVKAFVPLYALKANNVVRVEVIDPAQKACTTSQPLPVQIMPSSFLTLGGANDVTEFFTLLPHLNQSTTVLVPTAYLDHAQDNLLTVAYVLQGLSMQPSAFNFTATTANAFKPQGAFVSFEVPAKGLDSLVDVKLSHLVVRDKQKSVLFDSTGLDGLVVAQLIGGEGVLVSRVGDGVLNLTAPIELSSGTLSIIDSQGVKLTLNSNDEQQEFSLNESGRGLVYWFERFHLPFLIFGGVLLIALVFLTIRLAIRERQRRSNQTGA
jgi:hypothetical protein